MLVYNTEFIWIPTLQNQCIFWTRLWPRPKYRLVLQSTHPVAFCFITMHVKKPHIIEYWIDEIQDQSGSVQPYPNLQCLCS